MACNANEDGKSGRRGHRWHTTNLGEVEWEGQHWYAPSWNFSGYRAFSEPFVQFRLNRWLYALCWTGSDQPSALFDRATAWLIAHKVLLPGVTTLERSIAGVRARTAQRLWRQVLGGITADQTERLEALLVTPNGRRQSPLDRLRDGPTLQSAAELARAVASLDEVRLLAAGLPRTDRLLRTRVLALARFSGAAKASAVARPPAGRPSAGRPPTGDPDRLHPHAGGNGAGRRAGPVRHRGNADLHCRPEGRARSVSASGTEEVARMSERLDAAYRATAARLPGNASVRIETAADGTAALSLSALDKLDEPASLVALRAAATARIPRVDLPEILLEMHARTGFPSEFTHASEGGARAGALAISICAVLLAEACNTGLEPLIRLDTPALRPAELGAAELHSGGHLRPLQRHPDLGPGRHPARPRLGRR